MHGMAVAPSRVRENKKDYCDIALCRSFDMSGGGDVPTPATAGFAGSWLEGTPGGRPSASGHDWLERVPPGGHIL
jgi:hypothetical protein